MNWKFSRKYNNHLSSFNMIISNKLFHWIYLIYIDPVMSQPPPSNLIAWDVCPWCEVWCPWTEDVNCANNIPVLDSLNTLDWNVWQDTGWSVGSDIFLLFITQAIRIFETSSHTQKFTLMFPFWYLAFKIQKKNFFVTIEVCGEIVKFSHIGENTKENIINVWN